MTLFDPQDPDFEARVRRSFGSLTLMQTVGVRLLSVAPGEVEIDLPFREDLTQHHGFLAAAVVTAIVDVACGYAAMTLMPPGASVLTIEYKVNFLSPARGERMVAQARVVRPGRSVTVCAGDVFAATGGQEKLVATMLATIIQVSGAGGAQSAAAETGQRVDRHQAGASQHGPDWLTAVPFLVHLRAARIQRRVARPRVVPTSGRPRGRRAAGACLPQ